MLCIALILSQLPIFADQLSTAIQENDLKTVTALFAKDKTLVNTPTEEGLPIFLAIYSGNNDILAACIKAGANLESREYWGNTPLITASSNGQPEMVTMLLAKDANVNARNRDGNTALSLAVSSDIAIMNMLLEKGANLAIGDNNGVTPLMGAMRFSDNEKIDLLLLKGASFKNIDKQGNTMLHYAAMTQNFAMVIIAIDNGCDDATVINENGDTPLHSLFGFGRNDYNPATDVKSFDVNMTPQEIIDWKINTAKMHFEALPEKLRVKATKELGDEIPDDLTAVCTLLFNHGALINSLDDQGNSPLMGAAYNGDIALVKYLLSKKADLKVINEEGVNLSQAAATSGSTDLLQFFTDQGLSLKNVDDVGQTLLHSAVHSGNTAIINYLLDKGLDINALDNSGQSPIFRVFDQYDADLMVKNIILLTSKGAKVNLQDASGSSLLEMAVYNDNGQVVQALLDKGADVKLKNYEGNSPLDIATNNNSETALPLLKKAAGIK